MQTYSWSVSCTSQTYVHSAYYCANFVDGVDASCSRLTSDRVDAYRSDRVGRPAFCQRDLITVLRDVELTKVKR